MDMELEVVVRPVIAPGSARGLYPAETGTGSRLPPGPRAAGPSGSDPEGRSDASYATFGDPDGSTWVLQELTTRLPGRV